MARKLDPIGMSGNYFVMDMGCCGESLYAIVDGRNSRIVARDLLTMKEVNDEIKSLEACAVATTATPENGSSGLHNV